MSESWNRQARRIMSLTTVLTSGWLLGCQPVNQPPMQPPVQTARELGASVGGRYLLYLPPEYDAADSSRDWPLMLFLHGAGERGSDLEKVKIHGPPKLIAQGRHFPFIVVSPQCPEGRWWDIDVLSALLDHIVANYNVDRDRIYVTGLSMGGFGTWSLAAKEPHRFAAIAPICGGGEPADAPKLKHLPVWVFHGAVDNVVPIQRSKDMVEALEAVGGNVEFTTYPLAGHDSWTETYNNQDLYDWMLRQKRTPPPPEDAGQKAPQ